MLLFWLEWIGASLTLAGVWLTTRKMKIGWLLGIAGAFIYAYICFSARLYAESGLQALYAILGIYGWMAWRKLPLAGALRVYKIPTHFFLVSIVAWALLMLSTGALLDHYADTDVPFTDASMTAAGLVLTWQMARRYMECWIGWVITDLLNSLVFVYKDLYPTAFLYLCLATLAWYGHQQWKKQFELP
jgi:nicotinamide mononucleotide transporter